MPAGYDYERDQTIRRVWLDLDAAQPGRPDRRPRPRADRPAPAVRLHQRQRLAAAPAPPGRDPAPGATGRSRPCSISRSTAACCQDGLIDLLPGHVPEGAPLWGVAIDIGTTTVTVLAGRPGQRRRCAPRPPSTTARSPAARTSSRASSTPAKKAGPDEMRNLVPARSTSCSSASASAPAPGRAASAWFPSKSSRPPSPATAP